MLMNSVTNMVINCPSHCLGSVVMMIIINQSCSLSNDLSVRMVMTNSVPAMDITCCCSSNGVWRSIWRVMDSTNRGCSLWRYI